MAKPVIVCDFDDVLFPLIEGLSDHHNDAHGTTLTPEDFVSYNFNEVWGGSQQEANLIIEAFLANDNLHLEPLPGVQAALTRLSQDFQLVIVTARNHLFEPSTVRWLRHRLPDLFSEVVFAGNHHDGRGFRTKGEICRELQALLIIDDHPANLASAVQQGTDAILFGTKAWSSLEGLPKRVVHCETWPDVTEYIYGTWRHQRVS